AVRTAEIRSPRWCRARRHRRPTGQHRRRSLTHPHRRRLTLRRPSPSIAPALALMCSRPDLSVIAVNWNSKALLRQCLDSIFAQTDRWSIEIVVSGNASVDGCGDMLAAHFPAVRFVQSDKILGFGKANNAAVAHSRGEILLFLNPDTEVIG